MILRTYACESCGHFLEVELRADQWDADPPDCPRCADSPMDQQFKPPAITGSNRARAIRIAEDIAAKDYGVADMNVQSREGATANARYRDATPTSLPSTWSAPQAALAEAIQFGRESRLRYGSGLDVLQSTLKDGSQPDLIEMSKRRSMRVY